MSFSVGWPVVVEVLEVDASGGSEGLVGGGEDRERSVALEGLGQIDVVQGCNERVVHAGSSSVVGDVFRFVSGCVEGNGGKCKAGNQNERMCTVHAPTPCSALLKVGFFSRRARARGRFLSRWH